MDLSLKERLESWKAARSIGSSTPSPPRRTNKPLTEKRRRARINRSLAELKTILLADRPPASGSRSHKQTKLEKADILEMAVRHFRMLRIFENSDLDKYRAGYIACISEVERFLSIPDLTLSNFAEYIERDLKLKLLRHLEACEHEMETKGSNNNEEKPTSSKTKGPSLNNQKGPTSEISKSTPTARTKLSQKTKPEPPLISADQPLDFSKATGKIDKGKPEMPNYINLPIPIIDNRQPIYSHQTANIGQRTETLTTLKKDQYILLFPKFVELNETKFSSEYVTTTSPNNGNSILEILESEKIFTEKRKMTIDQNEPNKKNLSQVKDIKLEEQFNPIMDYQNSLDTSDDIDEPLDVKVDNFDDPMWRPW